MTGFVCRTCGALHEETHPVPTLNLKADLMTPPVGQRPNIFLQETDHPLWREQKHGITVERVQESVASILHRA